MSHYKPYPAYKDSGVEWIGKVPEHWQTAPVKAIANTLNGATPESTKAEYWDGEIAWYTPADIDNEVATELGAPRRYISQAGFESCAVRLAPPRSVILSTRAPIGSVGITTIPSTINQGCRALVPVGEVPSKLIASLLVAARNELRLRGNGTTFQELSTEALRSLRMPLPPPAERVSIVNHLDRETARIDALIAKKTEFIDLLARKRQALITHAVTKGLDPKAKMKDSGVEWIGEVPEHWRIFRIKRVAALRNVRCNESEDMGDYIGLEDVESGSGRYVPTASTSRQTEDSTVATFRAGDVLYGKLRPYLKKAIIADRDGICSTEFLVLQPKGILSDWLHKWLLTVEVTQQIESGCDGAKMPRANWEHVGSISIPAPALAEQKLILSKLNGVITKLELLMTKTQLSIDLLKKRRFALITAAVTGQIDVREAVEMASDLT